MTDDFWFLIVIGCILLFSWASALHALLYKRDSRAALAWIVVCVMFPPFGALFYFLFGINRVRTHGRRLGGPLTLLLHMGTEAAEEGLVPAIPPSAVPAAFQPIANLSDRITRQPLLGGNRVEPLSNGEEAFPAMLAAIGRARQSIYLSTYIFETNATGKKFIAALGAAVARGVDVRVILDGVGEYYSFPKAGWLLKRAKVPVARFFPPRVLPPSFFINLRNHRKILVVDGVEGFTGGMNIGDRHLAADSTKAERVEDLHFRVAGPVVAQMEQIFLADWILCMGREEPLPVRSGELRRGDAYCRAIADGPNDDIDKMAMILVGAAAAARERIFIMTPYFLPNRELVGALQSAALRGVVVRILLPAKNNLPFVKWASDNMLWELLQHGVRIAYQPPPFVHTKLFLVDDIYTIMGSANIDPRSLRLNFEMVMEIFDPALSQNLRARFVQALARSRETSLAEMDGRSLAVRIRDALCWLFTPYL
ncbi:MAG: PLDc N-terminal domain-containing protein [Desulfobacterales bacterium]|nr:PLDc N-terminal domain-containing protein [Desulfobacterales bacterium]